MKIIKRITLMIMPLLLISLIILITSYAWYIAESSKPIISPNSDYVDFDAMKHLSDSSARVIQELRCDI